MLVQDIRQYFIDELKDKNFTIDKTGAKTIELIGASFIADENAIFGSPNQEYIDAEIRWYETQSTNINTLEKIYGKKPAAWTYSANDYGEINSNYGTLIYSAKYYSQMWKAVDELIDNPDSRRACMVYNRPSIWKEYNEQGKSDFICTNAVTYYIRDNKVHAVVQMRSNDAVFGYKNDYAWQKYILKDVCEEVNRYRRRKKLSEYTTGNIHWQVQNLHVYERHFTLIKDDNV